MGGYGWYLAFLIAALLALYTQIVAVHPTQEVWRQVSMEAFGFRHVMLQSRHERLARKFHLVAQQYTIDGYRSKIKAAHGIYHSREDEINATKMFLLAKTNWEEANEETMEAEELKAKVEVEHGLYLSLLQNASFHEQRAAALQKEADGFANQSKFYQDIFTKYGAMVQNDEDLENAYLYNSTLEGQLYDNITKAEADRKDHMWICRWDWSRQYICGFLGGATALGKGKKLHAQQEEDYQKAMSLQQQVQLEQAKAMIASAKAAQMEEKARYDNLKAEEMHNETLLDEVKAAEEHMLELEDLQKELEDLKSSHEHVLEFERYQTLQVQLETQSRKEEEYAHGQWELGSDLLSKAKQEELESEEEYELAKKEATKQAELVASANELRQKLRLYSSMAAAFALVGVALFVMAVMTTRTVSLAYHMKMMIAGVSLSMTRHREGRNTSWEGRSILGDHQDRNSIRQLSFWFHHALCFVMVAGIQGNHLSCIFTVESLRMRGEILLEFSMAAALLKTLVFQGIPHASVLPSLNREYYRNISIRFAASTCYFTIQMILFLIVFGQDSAWVFGWMKSLHRFCLLWIMLFVITAVAHMRFIEYPHTLALDRNRGSAMSDLTFTPFSQGTWDQNSQSSDKISLLTNQMAADEETSVGHRMNGETESLMTVSRAEAPPPPSIPPSSYSSIAITAVSASNPILFPSPALQRLYEVSIQDEFFCILAHVEMGLFVGIILVIFGSLPNVANN
jgi:hypothetical protein